MAIQRWSDRVLLVTPTEDPGFSEDLNEVLGQVERDQQLSVVADLKEVDHLCSSNIALLLRLRKTVLNHRRALLLCNVTTQAWGVFLVTGLDAVFAFSDNVTTALTTVSIDQDNPGL
jgi:anti-anti-sigma factor